MQYTGVNAAASEVTLWRDKNVYVTRSCAMYQLLVAAAVAELALIIRPGWGGVYHKCGLFIYLCLFMMNSYNSTQKDTRKRK